MSKDHKDYKSSVFKDLLDKLQQESWQLELLISGFAIFGLFSATDFIEINHDIAKNENRLAETFLWFAATVSCWILISNLLIHVVLRGLWIGALGLRYVSGDIDYNELKYSPKFTNFLQKRIGSFDKYIATLENYCSVLFAVSFLFIFYFLACLFSLLAMLACVFLFLDTDLDGSWQKVSVFVGIALILFIIFGSFLTFFDFITQGFLKKKKWTSRIYFPIYKVFSLVTLSFLYRPLVYNFLDNRFGKRLSFILIPVYVAVVFMTSFHYKKSNYLKTDISSSEVFANPNNYDDLITKKNDFIKVATIPSKVITDSYLNVFVVYKESVEDRIFSYNKGLKPEFDQRGLKSTAVFWGDFSSSAFRKKDSLKREYHKTFNTIYSIYIDNKKYDSEFIATTNKFKKLGFETFIDIDTLSNGKHLLEITRKTIRKKDTTNRILAKIPFWKYKN
jgi:hypothetical protein